MTSVWPTWRGISWARSALAWIRSSRVRRHRTKPCRLRTGLAVLHPYKAWVPRRTSCGFLGGFRALSFGEAELHRLGTRDLHEANVRGDGPIQFRWLWIHPRQGREIEESEGHLDMGTKELDGPTHQRLLLKLPPKPTQCRRLLGLTTAACTSQRRGLKVTRTTAGRCQRTWQLRC